MISFCEYIWLDGTKPVQALRNKTRMLDFSNSLPTLDSFPIWGFDGSSTHQASGSHSDLILKPAYFVNDPIRGENHYLVLCEVLNTDGTAHETNYRAKLRQELQNSPSDEQAMFGFEQEYTLYQGERPLGWPTEKELAPQGPYYCGIGSDRTFGRDLVEAHAFACAEANLAIYGINAEVMPSQWEFQIGYRGLQHEAADPLTISDQVWIARWLLIRLAEDGNITINWSCKPKANWNGAGMHTNFSTQAMRDPETGWSSIHQLVEALSKHHPEHLAEYGFGLEERLTGLHETSDINTFKMGACDRGASIRIPEPVANKKCGYIEDRRPGANADPYRISTRILKTLHAMNESCF
ncbi:MAG: glutamine synthetase beta-grasp domain-containing protein [Myxococcaceae bacterium]|nr:glutamine synthetase beta-grasp domain-containing protein [Myxococcaceae bacterium]MBH2006134.1 glutamine synthetase beta-grasp domain-containing protein [Myxococcaceae bacterium]